MRLLAIVPEALPAARRLRRLGPGVEVVIGHTPEVIARAAPAAEVILYSSLAGGTPPFREVEAHTGPGLRWVHSFEAGLDRLLTPELIAGPVLVSNARGAYAPPLAEFAVYAILFFYKQTRRMLAQQQARRWEQFEVEAMAGKVFAVVGFGGVGAACARAARKLGMRVQALRRHPERRERGVETMFGPGELLAMLAGADVVLAAAPLTPDTRHLLNAAAFAAMKPSALFLNVGRGPVVEEAALADALRQHRIAGAALDVFEQEPLAADSPLWALDNVLLSPHCTDRTRDPHWTEVGMRCFLQNWKRWRAGQPLLTAVDKAAGY
ncbi:MAG: D-2-hydroxyacid dehydrogenase [Terriglobales bacterium]